MPNLGILLVLILVSAIPAIAVFIWFRVARYKFSTVVFFISLFVGATSLFAALFLQGFVSGIDILPPLTDSVGLFMEILIRIALTEELSRLLLLIPLFLLFRRFNVTGWTTDWARQPKYGENGITPIPLAETMGKASGLVAGLGFGILESAIYGAADPFNAFLRAFTATPLHAACGSRVGSSIMTFRERPALAVFQFISAVVIHGIYNLMVVFPGRFPPFIAIFIAFSALFSSVQAISRGMRAEAGEH